MATPLPSYWCHSCQSEIYPIGLPARPICPNCDSDFVEQIEDDDNPRELYAGDDMHSEASHSQTTDNLGWNLFGFGEAGHHHSDSRSNTFEDENDEYYDSNADGSAHVHHSSSGHHYDGSSRPRPSQARTTNVELGEEFANEFHSSLQRWLGPNSLSNLQVPHLAGSTSTNNQNAQEEPPSEAADNRQPRTQWQFYSLGPDINAGQGVPQPINFGSFIRQLLIGAGMPFSPMHGNPDDYAHNQAALDDIISRLMEQHPSHNAPPPTPEDTIKSLPHKEVTKDDVESELKCAVCKEEFKMDEETMVLPCAHQFHCDCIRPWLALNSTCPTW